MSNGINGVGGPQQPSPQSVGAEQAQNVKVSSHGQTVQYQPSVASLVADAAEESGQMLQDKSSSSLSRREARSKAGSRIREIMQKYLQGVGGVNQTERFEQLAESLKKLGNASSDEIRQLLKESHKGSDDESLDGPLLLALEEMLAAEGGHDDLLAAVREAKAAIGAELQDFYQEQVKSFDDVTDVYAQFLGDHSDEDFLDATGAMITRLGDDLQAQGGTVEPSRVKATVDTLYNLEVARNAYMSFASLVDKMQSLFDVK